MTSTKKTETPQSLLRRNYIEFTACPNRCALCWVPLRKLAETRANNQLELAHIFSGRGTRNSVTNVLLLCSSCHGSHHSHRYVYNNEPWPEVTTALLLKAKKELGEFDVWRLSEAVGFQPAFLEDLACRTIPPQFQTERLKWA